MIMILGHDMKKIFQDISLSIVTRRQKKGKKSTQGIEEEKNEIKKQED